MVTTRNYYAALVDLVDDEASSSSRHTKEQDTDARRRPAPLAKAPTTPRDAAQPQQPGAGTALLHAAAALSLAEAPQRPLEPAPNGALAQGHAEGQAQPPASGAEEEGLPSTAFAAAPSANGTAAEPQAGEGPATAAAAETAQPVLVDDSEITVTFERQEGRRAPRRQRDKSKLAQPLVWLDLEMTGLDPGRDTIIEIACLVSDGALEQVVEGPEIAIHHSEDVLAAMNEWCLEHHGPSGLTERCRQSQTSLAQAEQQVLAFLRQHVEPKEARLAGNSVHVDVAFLKAWMPELAEFLHYRIVDVTTVAELCHRWFPADHKRAPRKLAAHTAMADIKESLEQLRYYKSAIFKQPRRAA